MVFRIQIGIGCDDNVKWMRKLSLDFGNIFWFTKKKKNLIKLSRVEWNLRFKECLEENIQIYVAENKTLKYLLLYHLVSSNRSGNKYIFFMKTATTKPKLITFHC